MPLFRPSERAQNGTLRPRAEKICFAPAQEEEYIAENIRWTAIDYFNNSVVVELLEGKKQPGLFLVLDDVCATLHGGSAGADADLQKKLAGAANGHAHFQNTGDGFAVLHYAGTVSYSVDGFCDKNRDVLFPDLIEMMRTSQNSFIRQLYKADVQAEKTKTLNLKSRPTTAGSKIRSQASGLVAQLMKCTPHYIRCIKPNETKRPRDWDQLRVKHQVEYLGLKENIRVRRAGFAYRRPFAKFLHRYAILTKETWPIWDERQGDERKGVEWILASVRMERGQYQLGKTKLFIKAPESLFMLEEARDRKYNGYARVIQKAFKKYFARKRQDKQKQEAADLLFGHKQRRRASLNRNFVGDYIGLDGRPQIVSLLGRREKVSFAEIVKKYDRRFKACRRDLVLTGKCLFLIGREQIKTASNKKERIEVIKRKLPFGQISCVSLSTLQDGFVIIHTRDDYASLLELVFKTEFLLALSKGYKAETGHTLNIRFNNHLEFNVKKEGWGGGGVRKIKFSESSQGDSVVLKPSSKVLNVTVGPGLPSTTKITASRAPAALPSTRQSNQTRPTRPAAHVPMSASAPITRPGGPINVPTRRAPDPDQPRPRPPPNRPTVEPKKTNLVKERTGAPKKIVTGIQSMGMFTDPNGVSRGRIRAPPPPTSPAPPNQPTVHTAFRLPNIAPNGMHESNGRIQRVVGNGARTGSSVGSKSSSKKTLPATPSQPAPKPPMPALPKVRAVYDYSRQDADELEFKEGDIIEVLKENVGGWWQGRLNGKVGLFPSNYVE